MFSEAVSYVLQKLHKLHRNVKEEQRLFDGQDVFVCLYIYQQVMHAIVFTTKLCLSSWILSVGVWLLDTIVVLNKHLSGVATAIDKRHQ